MYVCMHVCVLNSAVDEYLRTCACKYIGIYIHTYIHTYMNAHIHTYIHTYTCTYVYG